MSRGDKIGHALGRVEALDGGLARPAERQARLVSRNRPGHGRGPQFGGRDGCLRPVRPRDWISFKNKGPLDIAVEGDKRLFNQYGIILVDPKKHPHVKVKPGQAFIDWPSCRRRGRTRSAATGSTGNSCSFPNANAPGA